MVRPIHAGHHWPQRLNVKAIVSLTILTEAKDPNHGIYLVARPFGHGVASRTLCRNSQTATKSLYWVAALVEMRMQSKSMCWFNEDWLSRLYKETMPGTVKRNYERESSANNKLAQFSRDEKQYGFLEEMGKREAFFF